MADDKPERPVWQAPKRRWAVPFMRIEWVCEWLSYWLHRWAFLDVLNQLGKLTLLIGLVLFIREALNADERRAEQRKQKHYQAWQVINGAIGQSGSGGGVVGRLHRLSSFTVLQPKRLCPHW